MSATGNVRPGDGEIEIDGKRYILRLTLGALCDIEERLGGDLPLVERLRNPKLADLLIILHALLIGGGAGLSLEALKRCDVDLAAAAAAIAKTFETLRAEGDA